jgi:hypothetical protein
MDDDHDPIPTWDPYTIDRGSACLGIWNHHEPLHTLYPCNNPIAGIQYTHHQLCACFHVGGEAWTALVKGRGSVLPNAPARPLVTRRRRSMLPTGGDDNEE